MAAPEAKGKDLKGYLAEIEKLCNEYLVEKAPSLPDGAREAIVKFGPWISLVLLVMAAPALFALFGLGTFLAPFSFLGGLGVGFGYTLSMIFTAVVMVIQVIALPGLFKRAKSSWTLMFYVALLEGVHQLVSFNLGGLIIGTLLSLYILFQVRSYYK
ncbi:chromate transporter [Candidatus Roizmanbacteria bacterium CG_4_10_14_0_8_um_filter_39_9]|uniref:Chromate transporter n=1 Tax=Candidatus Roizmanbacteria bacterium CG_4_10_14_0_8_um_filter_39_9 TaxID=1974829 RepID=A0A2M7QBG2_9BACT|nr:MAG: chromate transporter [Candidatus Roizmanbacteria bacterium CG_4_10_14_0_8_um_filter_39_9]